MPINVNQKKKDHTKNGHIKQCGLHDIALFLEIECPTFEISIDNMICSDLVILIVLKNTK